jgi:hypothetical protein
LSRAGLARAAGDVLTQPWLLWSIAAIFGVRDAILTALGGDRPDAGSFWAAGHAYLRDPAHLYDASAAAIARIHMVPLPGDLDAFLSPAPVALLAVPFGLLPKPAGIWAWTIFEAVCMVAGLLLLSRGLRFESRVSRPLFWLVAFYFPPLFADLSAGQRGGFALLLFAGAVALGPARPALAGALAGAAASLKFYPAAMAVGVGPRRLVPFSLGMVAAFGLLMVGTFLPVGAAGTSVYIRGVLLPILGSDDPDCAYDSTRSLFMRVVGGQPYYLPGDNGLLTVRSPLHLPEVAIFLSYLTVAALVLGAIWAAWRSGWSPAYGLALGFGLGALVPNEVFPYQFLPLLPLVLMVAVAAADARRWALLGLLGVALLGFVRPPCGLWFPNLWTLAGLAVYGIALWHHGLFLSDSNQRR